MADDVGYERHLGVCSPGAVCRVALEAAQTAPAPYDGPEWVCTFGDGQRLRSSNREGQTGGRTRINSPLGVGTRLDNRYVRFRQDREPARALMFAIFGQVWSMDYDGQDPATAEMIERWGLVRLDVTEVLAELALGETLADDDPQTICVYAAEELARRAPSPELLDRLLRIGYHGPRYVNPGDDSVNGSWAT